MEAETEKEFLRKITSKKIYKCEYFVKTTGKGLHFLNSSDIITKSLRDGNELMKHWDIAKR